MKMPILTPNINIGDIHIGTIESTASFNVGNNFLEDFTSNKKHNQGFGNIHGDRNSFPKTGVLLDHSNSNSETEDFPNRVKPFHYER